MMGIPFAEIVTLMLAAAASYMLTLALVLWLAGKYCDWYENR